MPAGKAGLRNLRPIIFMKIKDFISILKDSPKKGTVFNPWYDVDEENDIGPEAPGIRRSQLEAYLKERIGTAKYILMGEALGYQGGHFSGIAMTSERILLGYQKERGVIPKDVFSSIEPKRTSRPEVRPKGFSEPTATIVWECLLNMGVPATEFVIWNTFAWHPFNPKKGILSNRRPADDELEEGMTVLKSFLKLFPEAEVIAVGKVAEGELKAMGVDCLPVRHPANGGVPEFRRQVSIVVKK